MNAEQVVILMRCLEHGIRAAADMFEREIQPVNPYDLAKESVTYKTVTSADALKFFTRDQLVQLIEKLDPGFDCASLGINGLKARVIEIANNPVIETNEPGLSVVGGTFSPPGVIADPKAVEDGTKLLAFFEEAVKVREDFVRGYQAQMQCDLRCVRPGGACPQASGCYERLEG